MKKLILTEADFYWSPTGKTLRGGTRRLYDADLAVLVKRDGDIEILKDRAGRSKEEVKALLEFDERLILAL
jgi:predicted nucleotidyltransferase